MSGSWGQRWHWAAEASQSPSPAPARGLCLSAAHPLHTHRSGCPQLALAPPRRPGGGSLCMTWGSPQGAGGVGEEAGREAEERGLWLLSLQQVAGHLLRSPPEPRGQPSARPEFMQPEKELTESEWAEDRVQGTCLRGRRLKVTGTLESPSAQALTRGLGRGVHSSWEPEAPALDQRGEAAGPSPRSVALTDPRCSPLAPWVPSAQPSPPPAPWGCLELSDSWLVSVMTTVPPPRASSWTPRCLLFWPHSCPVLSI